MWCLTQLPSTQAQAFYDFLGIWEHNFVQSSRTDVFGAQSTPAREPWRVESYAALDSLTHERENPYYKYVPYTAGGGGMCVVFYVVLGFLTCPIMYLEPTDWLMNKENAG